MHLNPAVIVFSHLRWNFVYQRPQHLLERLGRNRRIYFIEEPVFEEGAAYVERTEPAENVVVLRPHTPVKEPGFAAAQMPGLLQLVAEFMKKERVGEHVVWMYTPLALPLLSAVDPVAIIYDCMDELSGFLNAPRELIEFESRLFQIADLVFTGGPSLYRAKKDRHPSVHCFPSSVDKVHFASEGAEASDQAGLQGKRVGYYGVIDERIDLEIVDALATSHPEWEIVMVGPVVKIEEASLPRHTNLHYFGQRQYSELPGYVRGWDVCMMPFARNSATKFISPTKTLEYMAARKPIVSTPITDVAEPYGEFVYLGDTAREFVEACEHAMQETAEERAARQARADLVLEKTSWDRTAQMMDQLIREASVRNVQKRLGARAGTPMTEQPVLVIGAGPTGLSAAYHLGEKALLIEQNDRVGGWCRSVTKDGFTFDYAGHIMFSGDPYVHEMYRILLGENVHWQHREAWVYSKDVYTRYPFQGALYGLPPDVIKECIVGAIEARFGSLHSKGAAGKPNGSANGHDKGHVNGKECVSDCCADGILESSAKLGKISSQTGEKTEPRNFEEFIYKVWGSGIAKHFAIPYNKKLWAVPLSEMETSWLGGRVPLPDLEEMIEGAIRPVAKPMGPNARFGYPLRGGFQALMDAFLPHLQGRLMMNTRVVGVSPLQRTVTLSDGSVQRYDSVISTMPLPTLIKVIGAAAPAEVRDAAAKLRNVSVRCVHLGIGRPNLTEKHWIYYPEDTVFHRIFVQGNASPYCNAPGGFGLTCEITYSEYKPLPCDGDALVQRCIEDCRKVGIIEEGDPVWTTDQCDLPYAYVVYDHSRKQNVEVIRNWLERYGIYLAGRYSEWEYYNSDHAFVSGKNVAERIISLQQSAAGLNAQAGTEFGVIASV